MQKKQVNSANGGAFLQKAAIQASELMLRCFLVSKPQAEILLRTSRII